MSEYQLIKGFAGVKRISDGAFIPASAKNKDWQAYQQWLAAGNEPDPMPPQSQGPMVPALKTIAVADPQNEEDAVNLKTLDERLNALTRTIRTTKIQE